MTMSYLHEQLILMHACVLKSIYLKTSTHYKSTFGTFKYIVHLVMLVIPHDVLLKDCCIHVLLCIFISAIGSYGHIFEAYIFSCVNVRVVELLMQALWLLKFAQTEEILVFSFVCEMNH